MQLRIHSTILVHGVLLHHAPRQVCHQLHMTNSDVKKSERKHRRRPSHKSVSVPVRVTEQCSVSHIMFWQDVLSLNLTVQAITYCSRPYSCPELNTSQMHLKANYLKRKTFVFCARPNLRCWNMHWTTKVLPYVSIDICFSLFPQFRNGQRLHFILAHQTVTDYTEHTERSLWRWEWQRRSFAYC